jgi:hypothetical protein
MEAAGIPMRNHDPLEKPETGPNVSHLSSGVQDATKLGDGQFLTWTKALWLQQKTMLII